jgi:hypothetical protein
MAFCGRTDIRDVDRGILLNAGLFDASQVAG